MVPHGTVVGIVTVGCLVGYFGGGAEDATETTVLVACGTIYSTAVCGIPDGVVAVTVFNWMDGIAATLVDVAVVTIDTTIMSVFGAGLDNGVVGETCAISTVTA